LEPVTLWTCVVAPSGDRKTPGFAVLLRALDRIEKENAPQHQEAHRAHQTRAQVAKEAMRRWRKACQEAVNANPPGDPPAMPIDAVDIGDFIEPALHHLRRALRWIRANCLSVVSLKDIRREALGGSLDCDETRDLLDRLVIAGWLRLEKTETGGRPRERWLTNPRLLETAPAGTAETAERV
jgi:hypothetical protein